jgi:MFS family permease
MASTLTGSAWAPLRRGRFRALWATQLATQVVLWMQTVGAVTVLKDVGASAAVIALVQTAVTLPAVLFALLSGALADLVDRRRLLTLVQAWMFLVCVALALLVATGAVSPGLVLALTFGLGVGVALTTPAAWALTLDVVGRAELPQAVALNGVALNVARAAGPAAAGLIAAAAGASVVFGVQAAIVAAAIVAVRALGPRPPVAGGPREPLRDAMAAGLRYARHATPLQHVLWRAVAFVFGASALWALVPVVAIRRLGADDLGLGLLFACLGIGAIAAAQVLPALRRRLSSDAILAVAAIGAASVLALLAVLRSAVAASAVLALGGASWMLALNTLAASVQFVVPAWVRARALAIHQLVTQGSLAAGAAAWGVATEAIGLTGALACAGVVVALGLSAGLRWRLSRHALADPSPITPFAEPSLAIDPELTDGPVLVSIEYELRGGANKEFTNLLRSLRALRRRDGATRWGVFEDLERPGTFIEQFLVPSWGEHLRQHHRATADDLDVIDASRALDRRGRPRVRHWLATSATSGASREGARRGDDSASP